MNHPLDFIPANKRKPAFFAFLTLTLILFAVFRVLDSPLRTAAAPNGIVSYELAGNIKPAAEILGSWDARAQLFAAFGLGLDYLFMPAYALTLYAWAFCSRRDATRARLPKSARGWDGARSRRRSSTQWKIFLSGNLCWGIFKRSGRVWRPSVRR